MHDLPSLQTSPLLLVVDDNEPARRMLRFALAPDGYEVIEAENGAQALDAYIRLRPDIVLLDAMMPVMNGFQACAEIRARPDGANVPILIITALADNETVARAFAAGATDFITKPVKLYVLRHRVRHLLRRRQAEEALREERDFTSAVLNTAGALVIVLDPQGRITRFNRACERTTGYSFDEVQGRQVWDLFLIPEQVESVKAIFESLRDGQFPNEYENYWVAKDESRRLIAWSNTVLLGDKGLVEHIISTGIDVTERVEAEKFLQRRNLELAALNSVAWALSTSLKLQDLLDESLSSTVNALGFAGGLISLADERAEDLRLFSHTTLPLPLVEHLETQCLDGTLCDFVYRAGKPLGLEDLREGTPVDADDLLKAGLHAYVGAPIIHKERVLGTICLFDAAPHPLVETDYVLLTAIGRQIGMAVENARLFEEVAQRRIYLERVLGAAPDAIVTLDARHRIVEWNSGAERLFGYSREEAIGQSIDRLVTNPDVFEEALDFTQRVMDKKEAPSIETVRYRKDGAPVDVIVAGSPVLVGDEFIGAVAVYTDITERKRAETKLKEYSERLEDMVEERTRELREAQEKLLAQQRLQQEIELAAQIQASLLPKQVPSFDGFEFAARALPARHVSGDLYDFILPDSETCHIVLADIAGKGIPAALLTSTARTLLRAETEHHDSPAAILSNVNRSLCQDLGQAEMFITFFAARLDVESGALTYANAGHTEALWRRQASQTCHTLSSTGLPIGIFADTAITEETIVSRPGDVLVFYSDGITEAANPQGELFGMERFSSLLADRAHLPVSELCECIIDAVEVFRAGAPRSDDLTLVILKALPRTVSFSYPGTLDHLNQITALVKQVALAYGDDFASQMELASSEIVTNVIRHAYSSSPGEMHGEVTLSPDRIQLDLYDDGISFDPDSLPDPDLSEPHEGGYGLFIARQLTDELDYTPSTPRGNRWRLVKLTEGRQTA